MYTDLFVAFVREIKVRIIDFSAIIILASIIASIIVSTAFAMH